MDDLSPLFKPHLKRREKLLSNASAVFADAIA